MWFDIFIGILLNMLQVVVNPEDRIKYDKNIDYLMYIDASISSVTIVDGMEVILISNWCRELTLWQKSIINVDS